MISLKKISVFFLFILLFSACNKDDVDDIIDLNNGDEVQFTAKIDGNDFTAINESIDAQLVLITINGTEAYFLTLGGGAFNGGNPTAVGLSFGDGNFNDLVAGKEHKGIVNEVGEQYALGTYQKEGNDPVSATTEDTENATIKVTLINKSEKIISGEFSFTAIDQQTGKSYSVTDGKFKNIEYSIQ